MLKVEFRRTALRGLVALAAGVLAPGMITAIAADLPPLPAGLAAPSKPTPAPVFDLPLANGGTMRADELRGKVVIARFWATW